MKVPTNNIMCPACPASLACLTGTSLFYWKYGDRLQRIRTGVDVHLSSLGTRYKADGTKEVFEKFSKEIILTLNMEEAGRCPGVGYIYPTTPPFAA